MSDQDISWEELHPATQGLLSRRGFLKGAGTGAAVTFLGFTVIGCSSTSTASSPDTTAKAVGASTTAAAGGSPTTAGPKGTAGANSLYSRLGGKAAIAAVVTAFLGNVGGDTRINTFFANTDLTRLNKLLVEQIGSATGGPETYTGRSMKSTHAGLKITAADFNALVEDLTKALDQYKVPAAEQQELLSALAGMQSDIVTA